MKLIIAIVNSDDSSSVQGALTEGGYFVTKLSTTGGFLKKGNTTFFVGTNDDKVEDCISRILYTNYGWCFSWWGNRICFKYWSIWKILKKEVA